jgi:hypothetical protein
MIIIIVTIIIIRCKIESNIYKQHKNRAKQTNLRKLLNWGWLKISLVEEN